ncbi:hypothetical protein JOL62DRAFT_368894 [Phyllosticta paracitricarpa]|uniref:Rna polymerase rpb1 c-terminal repeat domain-containing protein n=2 Tax=Phyllosticta TaxID=121621 RepID=A0ABR1MVI2_9PEZI
MSSSFTHHVEWIRRRVMLFSSALCCHAIRNASINWPSLKDRHIVIRVDLTLHSSSISEQSSRTPAMYSPRTRKLLEKEGDSRPKGNALKSSSRQSEYTPPTSPQVHPENLPPLPPSIPPSPALSSCQKSRHPSPAPSITSINASSQRSRHASPAPSSVSIASRATLRSHQPTVEDSLSESEEPISNSSTKSKSSVSQHQSKVEVPKGVTEAVAPDTPRLNKKRSDPKDATASTVSTNAPEIKSQVSWSAESDVLSQSDKKKSQPESKSEVADPAIVAAPKTQSQVSRSVRSESPSQTNKTGKSARDSTISQSIPQPDIVSPSDSASQQGDPPREQDQTGHATSSHSAIPDPATVTAPSPKSVAAKPDLHKASPSLSYIEARSGNHTPRSPSITAFPIPPRHPYPAYPDPYGSPHMPGYQQGYFYPPPNMSMTAPQGTPPHYPQYGGCNGSPFPMPYSSQRHNSTGSRASAFGEIASPQGGPGGGNGSAIDDDAGDLLSRISSAIPDLHLLLSRYNETRGQLGVREELIRKAEAAQADALKRKEDYIDKLTKELAEAAKHHSNESNKLRLEIGNLEDKRKELEEQIADAEKAKIEMQEAKASLEEQKKAVEEEKGSLEAAAKTDKETLSKELQDVKTKAAELEESKSKLEETTAKLEEERAKIEADKHQVEEKASEEKRELEKTLAGEKERLQKEAEEAQAKLKLESQEALGKAKSESQDALEKAKETSDAEKMALAVEFDRMQKDYHDESERRRVQMIDEHVKDKESLLSEFQRQKRELEESFEKVRKELESKLNAALSNYEEALKKERESRDLWNAERESLKKGWEEECEHLKKGWDEQRESLQAQHGAEKEDIKKSMEKAQAEAEKKAEDERQALVKERETMKKEWDEDKANLERVVGELKNIAGNFGAEKERMQKIIEGFGEPNIVKSKGDEYYLGAFSRLQRQVLAVSSNHFKKLPDPPAADVLARLPPNVPDFFADSTSAAHLRVSFVMYSISKILTTRIFEPFFFSPDGDADPSVKLLKAISTQLREKDLVREATWRQHTLSSLFRGPDAKRCINAAASSVVDEICKTLEPFLANKIDEELVHAEVRRIVKLAAETWRFACIEREMISTNLPGPGEACAEDEDDLFWPAQHFDAPNYPVLLRLFPVMRRESKHKLPKAAPEDADGKSDTGCVYSYGLALYEDSAPVLTRLKELGMADGPDGRKLQRRKPQEE